MKENLFEKLEGYDELGIYPCHMPGHKRQLSASSTDFYRMDITEIDGFDNLHHPEEILKEEEEKAAGIYGTERTFFLINGSTCGNLSAISACVKKKGTILVARNCHKSVYNAIYLNECKTEYLMPEMIEEFSVVGGITPESVLKALEKNSDIQAVMITSPTYDGVISDIAGIASVVHRFGIPLIVDEAHGAHFGLDSSLPKNSLENGADVVIHSLHKTLPSLTQTALLHVQGNIVDQERLERFQSIYQSTSPSYLLLSSMSRCLSIVEQEGKNRIQKMNEMLDDFYKKVQDLKELKVMDNSIIGRNGVFDFDRTKIVISTKNTTISGEELYEKLLLEYKIQMEMTAPQYVQAIMTFMDTQEGYDRLYQALRSIDQEISLTSKKDMEKISASKEQKNIIEEALTEQRDIFIDKAPTEQRDISIDKAPTEQRKITTDKTSAEKRNTSMERREDSFSSIYQKELMPKSAMTISEALDAKMEWKSVEDAEGEIAADFVCLYPPGIPLLAPGEQIEKKHVQMLKQLMERKLNLLGVEKGQLNVVR